MNHPILIENQKKKLDKPLWQLVCFAMFVFWQMGFIYFVGPSLTIDGKTPLPIDMDNATVLIAVCYVLSIFWMIFLPRIVVWTQRITTGVALASAIGLFLPLPGDALRLLIYVQIFCCCLMIGFETFIVVNYLSERSNIKYLTVSYGIACFLIAVLQNEFVPFTFPIFRFLMTGALALLLIFFLCMPASKEALPRYVKKSDGLAAPKRLMFASFVFMFVASLMAVSGPAIVGEIKHGVSIAYLVVALICFAVYVIYKKTKVHPFRFVPFFVGLGGIGFLLIFASDYVPALDYVACILIGVGLFPCLMVPLYGAVIMKTYPSKYISPLIIGLALVAVLVQGGMVEAFRTAPIMINLVYAVIMAVLVFIYTQIEPFFLFTLRRNITDEATVSATEKASEPIGESEDTSASAEASIDPLSVLTKREREVAELICLGYSNGDIAKMLFISEHTVKDYTKKIYPRLGVHSRMELAALANKYQPSQKE